MQNHEHACTLSTAPRPVAVAALYKCEDTYPSPWLLTTPYPNLTVSYTPILHKTLKASVNLHAAVWSYHNGFKQKMKKENVHTKLERHTHTQTQQCTRPSTTYPCKPQQAQTALIQSAVTTVTLGEEGNAFRPLENFIHIIAIAHSRSAHAEHWESFLSAFLHNICLGYGMW